MIYYLTVQQSIKDEVTGGVDIWQRVHSIHEVDECIGGLFVVFWQEDFLVDGTQHRHPIGGPEIVGLIDFRSCMDDFKRNSPADKMKYTNC